MKKPVFRKFSGAGNTFALLEASEVEGIPFSRAELARRICDRTRGISVDGVLYLEPGREGCDYVWDFYNADGSSAEMCGNAARCAGRFVHEVLGRPEDSPPVFLTGAGPVTVRKSGPVDYVAEMTPARPLRDNLSLKIPEGDFTGLWIDTGVPHFVLPVRDFSEVSSAICRRLRHHVELGSAGANVTLLKTIGENSAEAVTYERGVEDFTAACGTGAVAAAWKVTSGRAGSVRIRMPGGDLEVVLGGPKPLLKGPALFLGEFKPQTEFFK